MGNHIIYRIYNNVTERCYIGVTKAKLERKTRHFRELERKAHHSTHLQASYGKHGRKAFRFQVIETGLSKEDAYEHEVGWIDFYDSYRNGYNMTEGGETPSYVNCIPCNWNGTEYKSVADMARENGIPITTAHRWIRSGYAQDSGVPEYTKTCTWNGIEYKSIAECADELGLTETCIRHRLKQGYECDDDLRRCTPCEWNGVQYNSITEAAIANGVADSTMSQRLLLGYTCDKDVPSMGSGYFNKRCKPCEWNGVRYRSVAQAARANGVATNTMSNRIAKGYTSDDDLQTKSA